MNEWINVDCDVAISPHLLPAIQMTNTNATLPSLAMKNAATSATTPSIDRSSKSHRFQSLLFRQNNEKEQNSINSPARPARENFSSEAEKM